MPRRQNSDLPGARGGKNGPAPMSTAFARCCTSLANAPSISFGVPALTTSSRRPRARAPSCADCWWKAPSG